jgi:hypothetical protein
MKTKGGLLVLTLILCFFASCGKNSNESIVKNPVQQNQEEEQPDSNQNNQDQFNHNGQDNHPDASLNSVDSLDFNIGDIIELVSVKHKNNELTLIFKNQTTNKQKSVTSNIGENESSLKPGIKPSGDGQKLGFLHTDTSTQVLIVYAFHGDNNLYFRVSITEKDVAGSGDFMKFKVTFHKGEIQKSDTLGSGKCIKESSIKYK